MTPCRWASLKPQRLSTIFLSCLCIYPALVSPKDNLSTTGQLEITDCPLPIRLGKNIAMGRPFAATRRPFRTANVNPFCKSTGCRGWGTAAFFSHSKHQQPFHLLYTRLSPKSDPQEAVPCLMPARTEGYTLLYKQQVLRSLSGKRSTVLTRGLEQLLA